jgi:iron(III) transport system permease protein
VVDVAPADLAVAGPPRTRPPRGAPLLLVLTGVAISALFAAPLVFVVVRNFTEGSDVWGTLTSESTLRPLANSLWLALTVTLTTAFVGTLLAWLTVRTDLPGRRVWRLIVPLPLVIPSYVGASALLAGLAPGGLLADLLDPVGIGGPPDVSGFWGAYIVLVLLSYPYVYLPVAARLAAQSPSLEESARLLGRRPWAVFRTVVLPQTASAIAAGALLVALYTVSEFGAVSIMRYDTLTRRIYETRLLDRATSFALSLVLAVVALLLVVGERLAARGLARTEAARSRRPLVWPLRRWRWPAFATVAFITANAILGPLVVLGWWALRAARRDASVGRVGADLGDLAQPLSNTVLLGVTAAVLTVALVMPIAYLTARYRTAAGGVANALVVVGFALPGLVLALSLTAWVLDAPVLDAFYQTLPVLLLAYSLHFGGQALRASHVAVSGVPRRTVDAARLLGAGRLRRLLTIEVPLMLPGLAAAGGLVMLSTMKELPATLLLAPTGTETLATRIWSATESLFLGEVGMASLLLVAASGLLTWFLVVRHQERLDG